jgi:hypothetical protein
MRSPQSHCWLRVAPGKTRAGPRSARPGRSPGPRLLTTIVLSAPGMLPPGQPQPQTRPPARAFHGRDGPARNATVAVVALTAEKENHVAVHAPNRTVEALNETIHAYGRFGKAGPTPAGVVTPVRGFSRVN